MEPLKGKASRTSGLGSVCTKQQRIAELARKAPQMALTTLAHHIDLDWLQEAYRRTRKDAAVGVDEQTAGQYAEHLEENLRSLLERAQSGTYHAPPVRRVHIPKGDGQTRPLGIPTFEDKVLQRAVAMVLEPIYEQDFVEGSYGFRPQRSAHQALDALWKQTMDLRGGWVLEIDIHKFFDTLDHALLRSILSRRVRDGVILRLIGKWLNAGVMESGCVTHPDSGSPQGGVISPILSNAYLHEVLDTWFEGAVQPRLRGRAFLIRYADDAVLVFEKEEDARRVREVLPKRLGKYGLTLHPDKTRLVAFRQPQRANSHGDGPKPGTFDLLGFTHYWGWSRKGDWVVKRKTVSTRLSRALKRISQWCRVHRHRPVAQQWTALSSKLRGHYGYYGITGNLRSIEWFRRGSERIWRKWLDRRSAKTRMSWDRFAKLLLRYPLPPAMLPRSVYRVANP
jgi:group II intron reverse transcriptase/maturase